MLNIKRQPIAINTYYIMAIFGLSLLFVLSLKPNFMPAISGILLTLISFYVILKIKNRHYSNKLLFQTLSGRKVLPLMEESGAFARFDKNFNITYVSKEFINIMGIEEGNLLTILKNSSKKEDTIQKMEAAVKQDGTFNDLLELDILNKTYFIDTFVHKIANKNLTKAEYIIRCNDITSYIKTEEELKNQLFIDQLTKLPTRLKLVDVLNEPPKSKTTHAHTLLYIQIDSYEEINEFFGIDVGYKLLQDITAWLQKNLPTKNTTLYKFEHNNFAMHTTSRINLADLETYLRTLNTKLNSADFYINETTHDISFTIGVARGRKELLKHAYLALKEAHKTNKNYKIFNKKNIQEEKYLHNIAVNKGVKCALKEDRIVPFFQPILNIATNEVEKFESLIRIQNEDNSYQRPIEFLEIAKQSKLYPQLTRSMITASLKRLEYLQMPITINIAIDDILNAKVSSFILRKLQRHPFADLVTFEILETNEIQNYTKVANFIKKIKAFGCKVAIDDFGSGYSNFEQVLKLDIDYIKIDGSLIKNITTNKENEIVTKTIISFAKQLGVKTIAEFVSNEAIFEKVKMLGIDYAQGYYIGRPAPITVKK